MNDQNTSNKNHSGDKLSFLKYPRESALKRSGEQRQLDFKEIYQVTKQQQLTLQADRCLDCGNPYCEWKCPLHNYIPNWLELAGREEFEQAAELMHQTNPLPEICGRVCPQDRLCEQACTLNTGFGAVTIGAIEKNISDMALAKNWRPDLTQVQNTGKRVAIVGAGPAGLGCAELLVRNGVKPIVFDRYPEIGGLITFGIPGFKLEKHIVAKRRIFLENIGVEFQLNTEIGTDLSIEQLQTDYDAVFLAMGTYTPLDGELPGIDADGVIKALDYLIGNINQQQNYAMIDYPYLDMSDQRVIVLGGGDTAMDCVRSAIRQQPRTVHCIYRRDEAAMPGSRQEVKNAKEEGVQFKFHLQPVAIESTNGKVTGVRFKDLRRQNDNDKEIIIEIDRVIIAFGFAASPEHWFNTMGLELNPQGLVTTLSTKNPDLPYLQQTHVQGVYAGGDMVRGADLVVTAIAEGRQAAREILISFNVAPS